MQNWAHTSAAWKRLKVALAGVFIAYGQHRANERAWRRIRRDHERQVARRADVDRKFAKLKF